eukprot:4066057-Alexandrium_andersonii.AAC.1
MQLGPSRRVSPHRAQGTDTHMDCATNGRCRRVHDRSNSYGATQADEPDRTRGDLTSPRVDPYS